MRLTEEVITWAKNLGVDLVGIAPVERFKNAPLRMSPKGLLPEARSVIVLGLHHPDASVELGGEPTPHDLGPYAGQGIMNSMLDDFSFKMARFLEDKGYQTLPITASNIWRYHGYKDLKVDFAPDLAHRYAAVAAGLAEIGWNGLALTPQFGPRVRFVSIVTIAELDPTPMYNGKPLCDRCMACVKNCPTDAFRKEVKKINKIEIGDKTFQFPDTNKWRCSWAENFCLNLAHRIPEKVDEAVALRYLEKYGPRTGEEGSCLKFCMVPEKRYYDQNYCRAPRRKKEKANLSPAVLTARIKEICRRYAVDSIAIGSKKAFVSSSIHPEYHLPDVVSVISLELGVPKNGAANDKVMSALKERQANYVAWEVSHLLDIAGYSAVVASRIPGNSVARTLGAYRPEGLFVTVLTSAPLPGQVTRLVSLKKAPISPKALKVFCRKAGADLVGFFTDRRFRKFRKATEKRLGLPSVREIVRDTNWVYGSYYPEIKTETLRLKSPQDWLSEAKSVIVLGLHFPHASLDTAKVTPAETVGPFAFVQYETLNLLGDLALKVVKRLNEAGYQANVTFDLTGLASKVVNPRGLLPDMRANLFPAVLAGLAYPGIHGHPITKEYGVRQRFIAIVTDYPLPDDPLYGGSVACDTCRKPCIPACPTAAVKSEKIWLNLAGRKFNLGKIDCFACDWAKRYCLSGKEGPAHMGLDVTVPAPEKRTAEAIASAVEKVNWGIQKRLLSIAEECLRVCPAHKSKSA